MVWQDASKQPLKCSRSADSDREISIGKQTIGHWLIFVTYANGHQWGVISLAADVDKMSLATHANVSIILAPTHHFSPTHLGIPVQLLCWEVPTHQFPTKSTIEREEGHLPLTQNHNDVISLPWFAICSMIHNIMSYKRYVDNGQILMLLGLIECWLQNLPFQHKTSLSY